MVRIKNWSKMDESKINCGDGFTILHAWKHTKTDFKIHLRTNSHKKGYQVSLMNKVDTDELQFDILKVGYDFAINFMKCHIENPTLKV